MVLSGKTGSFREMWYKRFVIIPKAQMSLQALSGSREFGLRWKALDFLFLGFAPLGLIVLSIKIHLFIA